MFACMYTVIWAYRCIYGVWTHDSPSGFRWDVFRHLAESAACDLWRQSPYQHQAIASCLRARAQQVG